MKRWLQFISLILAASVWAHVPEPKRIPRLDDLTGNLVPSKNTLNNFACEHENWLTVLTKHRAFGVPGISKAPAAMGNSLNAEV